MKTTLNKIRKHSPCQDGWAKLLKHLGKTRADDEPLAITAILDSNGLDDALWCLRAVEGHDREIRLYAVWCARQVQHLMTDQRSIAAIDVAERHAHGNATDAELAAARAAASAAAEAAARDAAWAEESAAARGAERGAAWSAASAAQSDAKRAAAWSAARGAASAAERGAASAAASDAQAAELRRVCSEIAALKADAERYRMIRRGQKWSVIDGGGNVLQGSDLDAATDKTTGGAT